MMFVSQDKQAPHYSARPMPDEGWCIYEGREPIAYCDNKAYALAITQALNFQRLMLTVHALPIAPTAEPGLN